MKRTIALLTDFGYKSAYSGIMKGVIWSINPDANIADLSHAVGLGDLTEAFFVLEESFDYFPKGTVFVGVIDPGVGSDRKIIAMECSGRFFLLPDNGLAAMVLRRFGEAETRVYSVSNNDLFQIKVSNTFHGRDIFAPVAGWISMGLGIDKLGDEVSPQTLVDFAISEPKVLDGRIEGQVVRIDGFGNLITDITSVLLEKYFKSELVSINISDVVIGGISSFYSQGSGSDPVALIGSSGYLEIAVKNNNAALMLCSGKGSKVLVCLR